MPLGQAADDEQAESLTGLQIEGGWVAQPFVDRAVFLVGHTETAVFDLDHTAVGDLVSGDVDGRVRWREGGGVLDQLGEHVDHVTDRVATDGGTGDRQHLDAGVVLHLSDRTTDDVLERDRSAPATGWFRSGQHDEVFSVTPHARREVVEPEQLSQLVGVGLLAFQAVDDLELAVDERLAATGQVEEGVTDTLPHRGLFDSGAHSNLMDGGEGIRHLADLVFCLDHDGEHLVVDVHLFPLVEPFHNLWKTLVRDLEGRPPQAPELADHRTRHEQRNTDRHGQDQRDADTSEPGVTGRTRGDRVALGREIVGDQTFDLT